MKNLIKNGKFEEKKLKTMKYSLPVSTIIIITDCSPVLFNLVPCTVNA